MRWVNFRVIWAWKPPFFRFFKYLTTRPNNPTNYNNRPDILKLLPEPNRTRLLNNRPEPYPTNLVAVPSLLMGLNMTKINQTPLHYLVMNASCTLFFQLHTFWSMYCQGKTTKYEKENCCIIVYVHKYFTTRETILLRSQHSWFGFLKNSLIGFPSIIQ